LTASGDVDAGERAAWRPIVLVSDPPAMNTTEARYANHLEKLRLAGVILDWDFEAFKLRLAHGTFYTPDFLVIRSDPPIRQFHEVKGFLRDDAAVKVKVAAQLYPRFHFVIVRQAKGGRWSFQEVSRWAKSQTNSTNSTNSRT
jgi:hypothetical protein